jgi:hypothetical protein
MSCQFRYPHALHVLSAIIDDDQLPRSPGVTRERGDTLPGRFQWIAARDDDRRQTRERIARFHGGTASPRITENLAKESFGLHDALH